MNYVGGAYIDYGTEQRIFILNSALGEIRMFFDSLDNATDKNLNLVNHTGEANTAPTRNRWILPTRPLFVRYPSGTYSAMCAFGDKQLAIVDAYNEQILVYDARLGHSPIKVNSISFAVLRIAKNSNGTARVTSIAYNESRNSFILTDANGKVYYIQLNDTIPHPSGLATQIFSPRTGGRTTNDYTESEIFPKYAIDEIANIRIYFKAGVINSSRTGFSSGEITGWVDLPTDLFTEAGTITNPAGLIFAQNSDGNPSYSSFNHISSLGSRVYAHLVYEPQSRWGLQVGAGFDLSGYDFRCLFSPILDTSRRLVAIGLAYVSSAASPTVNAIQLRKIVLTRR